jgi:hypothetical protein
MTAAQKNQGATLWIGTKVADPAGDTFVQIKRVDSLGEFGPETDIKDVTCLEDTAKQKIKGIPDFGSIEVEGNRVMTDPGQEDLRQAGEDTDDDAYNFEVRIPGVGTTGANVKFSFKALVGKMKTAPGQVDDRLRFSATLAVTGAVTEGTYT